MSDKHQTPEGPLPDPDNVNQKLEQIIGQVQERRGYYTALGVILVAAVVVVFVLLNMEPAPDESQFADLWERCTPILEQYGRDLSAGSALSDLDSYIESVRGSEVEGQAIWLAAIYHYREATTSDKQTYDDRKPHLDKAIAYLEELKSERFDHFDLLLTKPGWFKRSGDAPTEELLAQVEADAKWWADHAYKEPLPDADRVAVLRTELGDIHLQFFGEHAPQHIKQFIKLCRRGTYNGTAFHFVRGGNFTPIGVMGGDPYTFFYNDPLNEKHILRWGKGGLGVDLPSEEARFKINHLRSIVTSQRIEKADWNNGVQFQILVATDRGLDRVHTPFAKVVEGMSVVDAIAKRKTAADHEEYKAKNEFTGVATRDLLVEPVVIHKAIVYENGKAMEHSFDLEEGEKTISALAGTTAAPLPPEKIYGGRSLQSVHAESAGELGLQFPFPEDVEADRASPQGERK